MSDQTRHIKPHDHSNLYQGGKLRSVNALIGGTHPGPVVPVTPATADELAGHVNDATDAHDASAVSFSPTAGIAATDVQAAIVEDAGDLAAHLADTTAAHAASAIGFTPNGSIAATDVQTAIQEVRDEATGSALTVADEGTPLSTAATTLDFVGGGVTASGTGATKTITIPAGAFPSGTSNPGSPSDGDLFYRTDLDLLIRYRSSGTRWVCTCLHTAPLNMQTSASNLPLSATGSIYAGMDTTGRSLWVERVALATYIPSGTSDATRFWTITTLTDGGSANAYGTFDTKTDGNNRTRHDLTTSGTMASGAVYFELVVTKTSTVGNLYVFPGGIIYRYIVT